MASYTGYIINDNETNPYSVWIPKLCGYIPENKIFKGFGSNTNNLTVNEVAMMRQTAKKCYLTSDLSSVGPYLYDSLNGLATKREMTTAITPENVNDVINRVDDVKFAPKQCVAQMAQSLPADNGLQTYHIDLWRPEPVCDYADTQGGTSCTLSQGTKVLVDFPDDRNIGYITRIILEPNEISNILRNILD